MFIEFPLLCKIKKVRLSCSNAINCNSFMTNSLSVKSISSSSGNCVTQYHNYNDLLLSSEAPDVMIVITSWAPHCELNSPAEKNSLLSFQIT